MGNITQLGTDELLKLSDSIYQHSIERTVTINKHDKQLMYDLFDKKFYTATPFNIWDSIDPVKGIIDNLLSHNVDHALSANQGRVLKELHDGFYNEYKVFEEKVIDTFSEIDKSIIKLEKRLDIHANHLTFHDDQITSLFKLSKTNKDNIDINKTSIDLIIKSISDLDIQKANKDLTNITDADFLTKGKQSGLIDEAQKKQPNGVACLDETGKIHVNELPDFILGQVLYGGNISNDEGLATVTSAFKDKYKYDKDTLQLTLNNAVTYESVYFIATVAGTIDHIIYHVGDWIISNGITWTTIGASDAVRTVNGMTGDVNISLLDLGGVSNQGGHIITSHGTSGQAAEDYNTSIYLAANDYSVMGAMESTRRGLRLGQGYANNTINLLLDVTDNHLKFGNGEIIDNYKKVYHEGNKPSPIDIGAVAAVKLGLSNMLYVDVAIPSDIDLPSALTPGTAMFLNGFNVSGYQANELLMYGSKDSADRYVTAFAINRDAQLRAYIANGMKTASKWNTAELWHSQNLNPNKVNGCLVVNPGTISNTYTEGLRVNNASNNTSILSIGCNPTSHTSVQDGQWTIRKAANNEFQIQYAMFGNVIRLTKEGDLHVKDNTYAVNFINTSDINLKENFKDFNNFNLDDIKLQWYNMIGSDTKRFGIIAQDVLKYAPELVSGTEWTEDKPDNHYSVATIDLLFLMIAKLRNDIKELKMQNNN